MWWILWFSYPNLYRNVKHCASGLWNFRISDALRDVEHILAPKGPSSSEFGALVLLNI